MARGEQWQDRAACRGMDVELFVPPDYTRGKRLEQLYADAKAVCNTEPCPVREECLTDALATETRSNRWGVRGGRTPDERHAAAKRKLRPVDCAACGRTFTPQTAKARYCSTVCVEKAKQLSWAKDNERRRRARQEAAA